MSRFPDQCASSSRVSESFVREEPPFSHYRLCKHNKKLWRGKKKRFERPRFRVNDYTRSTATAENCSDHLNVFHSDPINAKRAINELAVGDCRGEITDDRFINDSNKPGDGYSSAAEEFFDAYDENDPNREGCQIQVKFDTKGSLTMTIFGQDEPTTIDVWKEDIQKYGLYISLTNCTKDNNVKVYSGKTLLYETTDKQILVDKPLTNRVHNEAQTSVVLGAEEISETEEISVLSTKFKDSTMNSVEEEKEFSPISNVDFTSNSYELSQYTVDMSQSRTMDCQSSTSDVSMNENQLQLNPLADFTLPSLPLDTFTTESFDKSKAVLLTTEKRNEDDVTASHTFAPLIKSMSDSLIVSGNTMNCIRKESSEFPNLNASENTKTDEDEQDPSDKSVRNVDSNEWIGEEEEESVQRDYSSQLTESDVSQTRCIEFLNDDELVRPMTSAADAVKCMRQALKPINDQINDIKTKMIGMNIQPRTLSRHKFGTPQVSSDGNSYSEQPISIQRWLLTDPLEFSSSNELTLGNDFTRNHFPTTPTASRPTKRQTLVVFPGDFEDIASLSCNNWSKMSLTRSSLFTEPEDIYDERNDNARTRNRV